MTTEPHELVENGAFHIRETNGKIKKNKTKSSKHQIAVVANCLERFSFRLGGLPSTIKYYRELWCCLNQITEYVENIH